MESGLLDAVIGGVSGALAGGLVSWLFDRSKKRSDASLSLVQLLREMDHALDHIDKGHDDYVGKGRSYGIKLRKEARKHIPYLGTAVSDNVHDLTDQYEKLYRDLATNKVGEQRAGLVQSLHDKTEKVREAIEKGSHERLKLS
jgi:hypothetical protein